MNRSLAVSLALLALLGQTIPGALAQGRDWGPGPGGPGRGGEPRGPGPRGGPQGGPSHFMPEAWHGGHWERAHRGGRDGWWWVVGDAWYFYTAPVYPYPALPVTVVAPPAQPPTQYAYYCPNPPGYYPALAACPTPWQLVPAPGAPVAVAPAPSGGGIDKTTGGTIVGAATGGLVGAQFGHGSGNLAATAIGTLLGAFIGHEVGASLDRADEVAAEQAARTAYAAPLGQPITWNSAQTGHSGAITPVRDGHDQGGNYCREFTQTVTVSGQTSQAFGTACRTPDGSWRIVAQ